MKKSCHHHHYDTVLCQFSDSCMRMQGGDTTTADFNRVLSLGVTVPSYPSLCIYLKVAHFKLKVLLKTRILTAPSDVCRICSRCHKYSYCLLCCDHIHAQTLCKYLFTNSGFGHLWLKCCFLFGFLPQAAHGSG